LIAKQGNSRISHDSGNFVRHIEHPPVEAVIVVAENGDPSKTSMRYVWNDAAQLLDLALAPICDPITSEHHEIDAGSLTLSRDLMM
jgi:hypothetical protein